MQQDLRELFKKNREQQKGKPKSGHQDRFFNRLEEEFLVKKKSPIYWTKIAATILVILTIGYLGFTGFNTKKNIELKLVESENINNTTKEISLGDLSPDLKKVENYYVANINLELSKLEVSDDNKALIDRFLLQLSSLNTEYKKLNTELNQEGPNDQTISALIQNLQLRLQVLQKLKKKLNLLNNLKNEQITTNNV